jgi:hypothetical protein
MKKFLFGFLVGVFALGAASVPTATVKAQSTRVVNKTITAADTISFANVQSKIKSFTYALTKTSGTVAGKVYLEAGSINGQWTALDSLTLADVATVQQKTVIVTATNYLNYRWRNTNTSSATAAVKTAILRRVDE